MHRLHEAGVRVFVVRVSRRGVEITKELTLPNSLKLFTGRADYVEIAPAAGGMPLAIHGMSFADPRCRRACAKVQAASRRFGQYRHHAYEPDRRG